MNVKKYKFYANVIKEEQWLNEQLQAGYKCTNISSWGNYTFEQTNEKYVIRLDYQDYLSTHRFEEYKEIYEEFGWMHVKGSRFGSIHYWQKISDNRDDMFSDRQSKSNYYKRLMNYSLTFAIFFLVISFIIYDGNPLIVKELYLTQGLWEMEGSLFWKAFLFETPFVLLRLIPILILFVSAIQFYMSYMQYKKIKEELSR